MESNISDHDPQNFEVATAKLTKVARAAVSEAITANTQITEFSVVDISNFGQPVLGYWTAQNFISGYKFGAIVKIHYGMAFARKMLLLHEKELRDVPDHLVHGYMKRTCTEISSRIMNFFLGLDFSCGTGISIVTRGFDQIYVANDSSKQAIEVQWKFSSAEGSVSGSLCFKSLPSELVARIASLAS